MAARDSETLLPRSLRYRETFWVVADIVMTVVPIAVTIGSVIIIWLISSFQAWVTSGRSFPRLGLADQHKPQSHCNLFSIQLLLRGKPGVSTSMRKTNSGNNGFEKVMEPLEQQAEKNVEVRGWLSG